MNNCVDHYLHVASLFYLLLTIFKCRVLENGRNRVSKQQGEGHTPNKAKKKKEKKSNTSRWSLEQASPRADRHPPYAYNNLLYIQA